MVDGSQGQTVTSSQEEKSSDRRSCKTAMNDTFRNYIYLQIILIIINFKLKLISSELQLLMILNTVWHIYSVA